jgi:hypothetical protein
VEGGGCVTAAEEGEERRRSQAHRATAIRPRTHIRAQRRAAKMTAKSESIVVESVSGGGGGTVGGFTTPARNLKGRVM